MKGGKAAANWLTKGKHSNTAAKAWGHAKGTFKRTGGNVARKLAHGAKALWNNSKLVRGTARGGGVVAVGTGLIEGGISVYDYNKKKEKIEADKTKSKEQKEKEIEAAKTERNRDVSGAAGGAIGGIAGTAAGGVLGGMAAGALAGSVVPGIGNIVGAAVGLLVGAAGAYAGSELGKKAYDVASGNSPEKHHDGGPVGSNPTPQSEEVSAILKRGEIVMPDWWVNKTASIISAAPVGGDRVKFHNGGMNSSSKLQLSVQPITIGGTVTIKGDKSSKDYNVDELINNKEFVRKLFSRPEVIAAIQSNANINSNIKPVFDDAWAGGRLSSSSLYGKMTNGFG
jgi:hypothetical protein